MARGHRGQGPASWSEAGIADKLAVLAVLAMLGSIAAVLALPVLAIISSLIGA